MNAPPILETRRKLVDRLKDDEIVTAKLPQDRIYGETAATGTPWPFARMGEFEGVPGDGVIGNVHVFSKTNFTDEVNEIVELIAANLDSAVITLDGDRKAYLEVRQTRIIPDGAERGAWHGIVALKAVIKRDCAQP